MLLHVSHYVGQQLVPTNIPVTLTLGGVRALALG